MTERRHGEPGDASGEGRAAPLSISAVYATDALVEALSERRSAPSGHTRGTAFPDGADPDPAVRLLQSLIVDVDQGAPPLAAGQPASSGRRQRRRSARTIVALGVTTAVLATTGVAAAGGGLGGVFERSVSADRSRPHSDVRSGVRETGRSVVKGPNDAAPGGTGNGPSAAPTPEGDGARPGFGRSGSPRPEGRPEPRLAEAPDEQAEEPVATLPLKDEQPQGPVRVGKGDPPPGEPIRSGEPTESAEPVSSPTVSPSASVPPSPF